MCWYEIELFHEQSALMCIAPVREELSAAFHSCPFADEPPDDVNDQR